MQAVVSIAPSQVKERHCDFSWPGETKSRDPCRCGDCQFENASDTRCSRALQNG